jgi:hypothetical protein
MQQQDTNFTAIWKPIPDSSQELAITTPADHTLYEGSRGPGKTLTQLMFYRQFVGIGYGEYWRGVIFDREFDNLSGLVAESKKWFSKFDDGAKFLESASQYKWVWPTGEELLFRHVKKPADYEGFHGHEYPFIGWNELTKQPTALLYDKFMSCNRSTFVPERDTPKNQNGEYLTPDGKPLPPIPLKVFSTTNSTGPGRNWVKRRFIDAAPRGKILKNVVKVYDPLLKEEVEVTKTQVTLFGSYKENIYLPVSYIAELEMITDENLKRSWLHGDWDVISGGALDDVWSSKTHILPRFVVPHGWPVDRAFDWGSSHPFSVGWYAEANGEEAYIIVGNKRFTFCPPAGTIIRIAEWYGTKEIGTNVGLKMSAINIAKGILAKEFALRENGWISGEVYPGPADNQIRNVIQADVPTIEAQMAQHGVKWEASDKSPGSRINGLDLLRTRLENAKKKEGLAFYVMDNCKAFVELVPTLPRDEDKPDDVDTDAEDHLYDEVRYRVLKSKSGLTGPVKITRPC